MTASRRTAAYASLLLFIVSAIALAETLQAAEKAYHRPIVLRYLQMGSAVSVLPLAAWLFPAPHCRSYLTFVRKLWLPVLIVAVLTFGGGVLWTIALTGTSVGVSTALTRTKPIFIFLLSLGLRMTRLTLAPALATLIALGGVTLLLVAGLQRRNDSSSAEEETWWGITLTLVAAFVWAGADLYLQHIATTRFGAAPAVGVQMLAFQASTGLWDLLAFWPAVPIAAALTAEPAIQLPPSSAVPLIAAACASLVLTNLSISVGIACSSAFFMGVGSLLALPAAFVADYFLHGTVPDAASAGGAALVVLAFLVLSLGTPREDEATQGASRKGGSSAAKERLIDPGGPPVGGERGSA